ncbi:hypothetical protein N0V90_005169 [Kalmusia sp. IMI 367209]|nr:hypothetical protein N0V90_005169 [Kalmusia sp. IMI 367209]
MAATLADTSKSAWTLTDPFHRSPYPAISPQRPELAQTGRTVLVTGGNAGIGYAIAKAFLQASARKVIVTGRRIEATKDAAVQLASSNSQAQAIGIACDMSDAKAVDELWDSLEQEGTTIDVLILNAVKVPNAKPILENGIEAVWQDFDANVRAQLQMTERFYKQREEISGRKYLINVSTFAIHDHNISAMRPGYGLTKNSAALAFQLIAQDIPPEKMQIINMNPGGVFTQNARNAGYDENSYQYNNPDLPGQFAVWLASPEATFLHGRFVWTEWDVDALKSGPIKKRIDEDPFYLKVGVRGL